MVTFKKLMVAAGLAMAAVFSMPTASFASLEEIDNYTLDTKTNLEWLDVTETEGMSYNTAGETFAPNGWHYATLSDVLGLATDAGFPLLDNGGGLYITEITSSDPSYAEMASALRNLGALLGWTITDPSDPGTAALFDEGDNPGYLSLFINTGNPANMIAAMIGEGSQFSKTDGYDEIGSLLVRNSPDVAVTPLPGSAVLFASSLGLVGFTAWRKKSPGQLIG